jgi:2-polyprenyl-6-methoxyphenol hydroxylase-like FAD-dependent oxidoreductase
MQRAPEIHAQTLLTFFDQDALEDVLRRQLSRRFEVYVELGTKVEAFGQAADHVEVWLHESLDRNAKEDTARVQYLVGTDGVRRIVRSALGFGFMPGSCFERMGIIYDDAVITGLED